MQRKKARSYLNGLKLEAPAWVPHVLLQKSLSDEPEMYVDWNIKWVE